MFIRTKDGDAVNAALVMDIYVIQIGNVYNVDYININEDSDTLASFDNEIDARNYVAVLIDELNGTKPLGYAFSWLKNLKVKDTSLKVDSVEAVKHKDEILTDGLWF